MITPQELEFFRARHKGPNVEATLHYALQMADDYAELHAGKFLPSISDGVAQLAFRYTLQGDPGEKVLIRKAIDALLELGEACYAAAAES